MLAAFAAGALERDFVAVVRFQGPRANGMPELHKLTPPLGALQKKGFRVALVTDGRMSGASGQVPAAIHVSPEVLAGGPLGRVRNGDVIRVDAHAGTLAALVDAAEWQRARAGDAGAGAGRGERPRPRPRALRRHAQECRLGRGGGVHMAVGDTARRLDPLELANHGPVIPVIVIERAERRGADGARALRRRRSGARGDLADAGGAGRDRGDRPIDPRRHRRRRHGAQRCRRARRACRGGALRGQPRLLAAHRGGVSRDRPRAAARRGDGERGDARRRSRLSLPQVLSRLPPPAARRR